jgi:hypothetical protein
MRQNEKNKYRQRSESERILKIVSGFSPFALEIKIKEEKSIGKAKASSRHNLYISCMQIYIGCLLHLNISFLSPFGLHIHHIRTLLRPRVVLSVPFTLAGSSLADAAEQKREGTDTDD